MPAASLAMGEKLGGALLGWLKSLIGGDGDVGRDAGSGPVGCGVGVADTALADADAEVGIDAVEDTDVGGSAGGFADDDGAMKHLQAVDEMLGGGICARRSEHEERRRGQLAAGDGRTSPHAGLVDFAWVP